MIRAFFYLGCVALLGVAVYLKIGVIKEKRNAPTISIANEFEKHGKPVEIHRISKGDLKFFERGTGQFSNQHVELFVSKIQWRKIKKGQAARLLGADGNYYSGKVSWVARSPNVETGLYNVRVSPEKAFMADHQKKVVVDINTKTLHNIISIPSASIEQIGKTPFVWVMTDDGKVLKREIKKGEQSEMYTQILDGLNVGEEIIIRGASSLEKGDVARIVNLEKRDD